MFGQYMIFNSTHALDTKAMREGPPGCAADRAAIAPLRKYINTDQLDNDNLKKLPELCFNVSLT